jgi:hypothetical protein
MIIPSDKDYLETKQIMLGKQVMKQEFQPLAEWMGKTYGVKPINIYYDTIDNGARPRLKICFEHPPEKASSQGCPGFALDEETRQAIADKFLEILKVQGLIQYNGRSRKSTSHYQTENIWVISGYFTSVARMEAYERIAQEKMKELKKALAHPDLWEISSAFASTTFFVFTDEQVKTYRNSPLHKEWTDAFFELLSQYDEFRCFKRESFFTNLDSKENFDQRYQSNWYYYYK